jgi:YD repeat-containing protein
MERMRINGRYKTRCGAIVAVHDGVGHTITHDGQVGAFRFDYDELGNTICRGNTDYDLVHAVQMSASEPKTKVIGCDLCEQENGS